MSGLSPAALVRAALPPLSTLTAGSRLSCAWLDRKGQLLKQGERCLSELAAELQGKALELCLHPQDSLLACTELPPLAPGRLSDAVTLAADALLLGGEQDVHLVHGPRDADGQVQLAWLDRATLHELQQLLWKHLLQPRGLFAAPCFLALAEPGTCSATLRDGYLLVRQDVQRAWVHALADEARTQLDGHPLHWLDETSATASEACWTGPTPGWNLLQGLQHQARSKQNWGRAVACCAMAALVWTLGLNLYAAHLADEGRELKARMVSRVQEVFPQLPVVLNPLQQARQQRDARLAGISTAGPASFSALVQQASSHLPSVVGAVERLEFDGNELALTLRSPARNTPADKPWESALAQVGLEASLTARQWNLKPLSAEPSAPSAGAEVGDE